MYYEDAALFVFRSSLITVLGEEDEQEEKVRTCAYHSSNSCTFQKACALVSVLLQYSAMLS